MPLRDKGVSRRSSRHCRRSTRLTLFCSFPECRLNPLWYPPISNQALIGLIMQWGAVAMTGLIALTRHEVLVHNCSVPRKNSEACMKSLLMAAAGGKGLPKDTLDYYRIVPESHATAALYAYTPWVLQGSGGTWLAWSIARQFDRHVTDWNLDSSYSSAASSTNEPQTATTDLGSTTSSDSSVYTVDSGGTCWEADNLLGCEEGVVVCNGSRTCQTLQVGDRIACSLDACAAGQNSTPGTTDDVGSGRHADEDQGQACGQFTVPEGGTCWDAARALGCGESSLVNCTEPSATCGSMWPGDVLACSRNCCHW